MSGTLSEAVRAHQSRVFQAFTADLITIFKTAGNAWDKRLEAWQHEVRVSAYLEDRDRLLLNDLQTHLFD